MQAELGALVGISKTLSATPVVTHRGSASWVPPLVGWCKLNMDGSRSNSSLGLVHVVNWCVTNMDGG
ncbi:hypothetical protein V6N12_018609 [Hibiscus sabdariffa]